MNIIDLRSDTVTKPTPDMRAAMLDAEVGDDVYGEDPTGNRLESLVAKRLGFAAAMFVPSGTQSNLLGLLTHCGRGDEYIVGQTAHTYKYEGGGAAVLGGIQPQPLDFEPDGTLDLDKVAKAIKPDNIHFARTRLLCLENTMAGKVLPLDYLAGAAAFCRARGLSLHLDGARLFNAAVALGVAASEISRHFDSVSVCLSKGLGAPIGSVLCSSEAFIHRARRWRKVAGGGMRQVGIIAAAGIYALENHVERLAEDHANARALAAGLGAIGSIEVAAPQTNMVFVPLPEGCAGKLAAFLRTRNIVITPAPLLRLVTHLHITAADIESVVQAFADFFARRS